MTPPTNDRSASIRSAIRGSALPLVPRLDDIVGTLASARTALLRADPGSGKSTLVPLALAASDSFPDCRVVMLEPRRVAAVGVASRMADLSGDRLGGFVGYSVRMDRRVSRDTRIEVVTEGLLARRMIDDGALDGVGAVIFDEFHERSIHADLALSFLLDLRTLRPDIAVLAMSATMDVSRVVSFLSGASGGDVPVIDCPGRPYPVSVEYRPSRASGRIGEGVAPAVVDSLRSEAPQGGGDVLVFLPGRREIDDAIAAVRSALGSKGQGSIELLALHGGIPLSIQREIIAPGRGAGSSPRPRPRRVIFATNIAQTSVTVPGVSTVIDTGLVRVSRRHPGSGMDRLVLESASEADCDQRAGRAGRLGPGRCVRLWSPGDPRPREIEPEILRSDLAPLVLDCALWGVSSPHSLQWLDPPQESAVLDGLDLLRELGAVDGAGRPSERGRRMARLGVHPRLAALVLDGSAAGLGSVASVAAAALSDRDQSGIRDDADFLRRLAALRGQRDGDDRSPSFYAWRQRVYELAGDLLARSGGGGPVSFGFQEELRIGPLIARAFPDRIAKKQESGTFRIPAGREFRVDGPLAREDWIVIPEADAGDRCGVVRLAVALGAEDAVGILAAAYPESAAERIRVEWEDLRPRTLLSRSADRLAVSERRGKTDAESLPAAFGKLLSQRSLSILPWASKDASPALLLDRIRFWGRRGGPADAFGDEALIADSAAWLGPFLSVDGGPVIDAAGLRDALRARLGYRDAAELDRLVPETFTTPAGTRRKLEYSGDDVFLNVRIQEVFGLPRTPLILGTPVTIRLLSPAERPLQTTRDLESFWRSTYAEVRKEMRGRYPRHYWPEDPLIAEPTSRPKPRGT